MAGHECDQLGRAVRDQIEPQIGASRCQLRIESLQLVGIVIVGDRTNGAFDSLFFVSCPARMSYRNL